jgi:hypothetical protein
MGSLIHHESWDGVTAPSIPAGWTVSSPVKTDASPTGGISPLSSLNVLACATSGTNTHYPATYSTPDSAGGIVLVMASFNAATTTNNQTFGVFARGSAYPLVIASSTFYWAQLSPNGLTCRLYSVVGGTQTVLATVILGASLSTNLWYNVSLQCEGSSITVQVTRASDGYFLNNSGTFAAVGANAIAVVDTSVTGSGYAGLTLQSRSDNAYSDEFYFYQDSTTSQPALIRSQPVLQRACGRGKVIQPLAVRFGTPVVPPLPFSHGIVWLDTSRRRTAIDRGWVYQPVPARIAPPASIPFAWWPTIRWVDPSKPRRRIAPGRAATPRSFARLPVPASVPFAFWPTIRWVDPSKIRRQAARGRVWTPGAVPMPGSVIYGGFTQQYIRSVNPPVQYGTELFLSWTSDAPPGLVFQVYENDQLVWHGISTYCTLPLPPGTVRFDIGTVGFTQQLIDFSSLLPPLPLLHAELNWLGGTFEGADISGFHVYGEEAPGSGIDYTSILATVPAYTAGIVTDGFGYGGFGEGGFGQSTGSYSWISEPLSSGIWHFAVVPFDTSGNEGTISTTLVRISAPPGEPLPFADRSRLHYTYNATLHEVTLRWNASPG